MSAPNKDFDPKQVSDLGEQAIEAMVSSALSAISAAASLDEWKSVKIDHFGDRAPISLANREIGALPPAAKAEVGKRVGQAKATIKAALDAREGELIELRDSQVLLAESVDVTVPVNRQPKGGRHPLTTLMERLSDVFVAMGYEIAEGPELELDWANFDALNFPKGHPARLMQDTFFIESQDSGMVMRTHTSPIQVRAMLERELPVYVVAPGRVYRTDELDATHTPVFHQIEGLAVDKGLTMADLRGTLNHLAHVMFGPQIDIRWRPSFFPFTEPSAEVDLKCFVCLGLNSDGCRACGGEGWIEWGGCGMVNPKVLIAVGIDPEIYSGFAFGMGIERTLMFRSGVADMRDMVEGDIRFTRAFGLDS